MLMKHRDMYSLQIHIGAGTEVLVGFNTGHGETGIQLQPCAKRNHGPP